MKKAQDRDDLKLAWVTRSFQTKDTITIIIATTSLGFAKNGKTFLLLHLLAQESLLQGH